MKFSLVIPTRNRADMLATALTSALAQRHDDYEVLVSNNDCSDDTDEVVGAHDHPGLRYIRTDRAMSMVDHWNFALGHAQGDWVLVLCDDDALMPDALAYLDHLIDAYPKVDVFKYAEATYYYDDGVARSGNSLKYRRPRPNAVTVGDSSRRLRTIFRTLDTELPKLLNCAVRRETLEQMRERHGAICHRWDPDYSAGILMLGNTHRYATVHNPLMLWGKNLVSFGAGAQVDPELSLRFFLEFKDFDGAFSYSPYPRLVTLLTNSQYDTLHRARELLGETAADLEVDPVIFRRRLLDDIDIYVRGGHDEYRQHRETVRRDLAEIAKSAWVGSVWTNVAVQLGRGYATLAGQRGRSRRIRGADAGFSNIAEAAEYFSKSLR